MAKVFFMHNLFIDYRNPLFEKLNEKFELTMLMTREFIVDETKKELYKRDMPKNLKYKSFKHYKIFGSRYLVAFGVFPYLLFRDYDIVIVSDPHTFDPYLAFIASKLRRKKFIIWTETFEWKRAKRAMMLEPFVR